MSLAQTGRRLSTMALLVWACRATPPPPEAGALRRIDCIDDTPSSELPTVRATPSLVERDPWVLPDDEQGTPHATRLLASVEGHFVPNSNSGLWLSSTGAANFVRLPFQGRCTVATRGAGRTYCGSPDEPRVHVIGEGATVPSASVALGTGTFDLALDGRTLYSAQVDVGLVAYPLDALGAPTAESPKNLLPGRILALDGDGAGRLAALDGEGRLHLFQGGLPVRSWSLDGPPIRVQLGPGEVRVSLGSEGVALVDLASGNVQRLSVPGVVTATDRRDELLAVATTSGLFLYDLRRAERAIGFVPALFGLLDVRFEQGGLLGLDWRVVRRFEVNPAGVVGRVDAPRAVLFSEGSRVSMPVLNRSAEARSVLGAVVPADGTLWRCIWADRPSELSLLTDVTSGESHRFVINVVRSGQRLAVGEPLPVPNAGRFAGRRLYIVQFDCALQFPSWKELAWLAGRGAPDPMLVYWTDVKSDGAAWKRLWGLPDARSSLELMGGVDRYEELFRLVRLIDGPDDGVVLSVDADGQVAGLDQFYRGRHALPPFRWR
jgi:hypothetical protein